MKLLLRAARLKAHGKKHQHETHQTWTQNLSAEIPKTPLHTLTTVSMAPGVYGFEDDAIDA